MEPLGEVRDDGAGRAVRFERRYAVAPAAVWAALTEPEQLRGWLTEATTFDHEVGGRVELRFGDEPNQTINGSIRVYDPPRALEYEWHWPGQATSTVRFELRSDGGGTLLVLDHRGLPAESATGYAAGWHAYLDRLHDDAADWDERFRKVLPRYRELVASII
jgi:uncharacterized protein YndB with AHSA1/START domain